MDTKLILPKNGFLPNSCYFVSLQERDYEVSGWGQLFRPFKQALDMSDMLRSTKNSFYQGTVITHCCGARGEFAYAIIKFT